ncbi:hypothetical protein LSTR_LSTR009811 [Laodelphax striatellus]|uniref:Uncharacterized protein n=1 Tax=Laodelphax striatellus TaxID=195883 RepID=A0A482WIK6_LAOST|nr:hypothetical protein LSTR_LSTR009811 [Laodelphax striatellus]
MYRGRGRSVPRRGGPQRPYDPFGSIEDRTRRMDEYHANPTFRPQVNYFASCSTRALRGHQQKRHEQFTEKKNKEVIEAVTTSTVARFQGHFDKLTESLNTIGVSLTPNDVPVPVSSRVIGFSTARLAKRVADVPDLQRKVPANVTVFQIYRVLSAAFEIKLLDNRKIVINNLLSEFKIFSDRDENFLECARSVSIFPTDVAVALSLGHVIRALITYHYQRNVYMSYVTANACGACHT